MRVQVAPEVLRWASERARRDGIDVKKRFKQLASWETGEARPTLKQLEAFAKATHTPVGSYFVPVPPAEKLPIADFRVGAEFQAELPSGNLLDIIYACQRRQDWFADHARLERFDPVEWVGAFTLQDSPAFVAAKMRHQLKLDLGDRGELGDWRDFHRELIARLENQGVLVATSGVVGNDTSRRLDPLEFRGFCLADPLAPLIFVNGADLKAAQTFTLCHELAHLTLGHSGVSAEDPAIFHDERVEAWCDDFATELAVPIGSVPRNVVRRDPLEQVARVSRELKASPLVALRRVVEVQQLASGGIAQEFSRLRGQLSAKRRSSGGNFYATAVVRVGRRFAISVIASTLESRTTYTEAFRLLGIKKGSSFDELASRMGFQP